MKERYGSDDTVHGMETVGNSLGRLRGEGPGFREGGQRGNRGK